MSDSQFETTVGICVIALTRYLMKKYSIDQEKAYKKLLGMELYKLLNDRETRLYLETNDYLCEACNTELEFSVNQLYEFINE